MSIAHIDDEITKQLSLLEQEIKSLRFETYYEFTVSESKNIFNKDKLNFQGIYLIEIEKSDKNLSFSQWVGKFKKEWENKKFFKRPQIRQKSINNIQLNDNWIPMYLGKSEKVGNRLDKHLFLDNKKSTYALKLYDKAFLKHEKIRIKAIEINVENYDPIVSFIESKLREVINPIIGKQ